MHSRKTERPGLSAVPLPPLQQCDCSREAAKMSDRFCPLITSPPRHTHCPLTPSPPLAPARGRGVGVRGRHPPLPRRPIRLPGPADDLHCSRAIAHAKPRSREDERPILSADHVAPPRHTHCPLTPNPPLAPARGRGVGGEGATSPLSRRPVRLPTAHSPPKTEN
jgi:hypothetical protein